MARDIEALQLVITANTRQLEASMDRASAQTGKALAVIENRATQTEGRLARLGASFKGGLFGNVFSEARNQMQGFAGQIPVVGGALSGLTGPLLALSGAAVAASVGLDRARKAMQFADDLVTSADKLGVGVEALQELRAAAEASDVPVAKLDDGLAKLTRTIGAVQTGLGGKEAKKAFATLDITPEQLANIRTADEIIPLLADKLSAISGTAAETQIAKKLGIEDLLPLLRQGSAGLSELREEARALGIVMSDDVARRAADANEELRIAGEVISKNLTIAFAELAPYIANATSAMADQIPKLAELVRQAAAFGMQVSDVFNRAARGYAAAQDYATATGKLLRDPRQGREAFGVARGRQRGRVAAAAQAEREAQDKRNFNLFGTNPRPVVDTPDVGGFNPAVDPPRRTRTPRARKGPRGKSAEQLAREAERAAQEALRRLRDYEDAVDGIASRDLSAREAAAKTAEERYELGRERAGMEREQLVEERARAVQDGKLTQAQADRLNALDASVDILEDQNAVAELTRAIEERAAKAAEEVYRLSAEALGIEAGMATTLTQRAEVERRILALAQAEERRRLEQEIAAGEISNPQAARYNLGTRQAGERSAQTANPLGRGPLDAGADQIANGILDQDGAADRYAAEMARIQELRNQNVLSEQQAQQAMAQSAAAYNEQRLAGAQSFFGALSGLANSENKKLAAIGKAAAIAQATIDGVLAVQKALASVPPPYNFAVAAAVGAVAAVNVAKIAGFEKGGWTGPGARNKPAGIVHAEEMVIRKGPAADFRAELEHLNRTGKLPGYATGGFVMPSAPRLPSMDRIAAVTSARPVAAPVQHFSVDARGAILADTLMSQMREVGARAVVGGSRQAQADLAKRERYNLNAAR
jgi:hypothetical protein